MNEPNFNVIITSPTGLEPDTQIINVMNRPTGKSIFRCCGSKKSIIACLSAILGNLLNQGVINELDVLVCLQLASKHSEFIEEEE